MHQLFVNSGEEAVPAEDIAEWLEVDTYYPHQMVRTNEEILADVKTIRGESPYTEGTSEKEVQEKPMKNSSAVRAYFDGIINFLREPDILRLMPCEFHLQEACFIGIK